jgi:hypothetical protein
LNPDKPSKDIELSSLFPKRHRSLLVTGVYGLVWCKA